MGTLGPTPTSRASSSAWAGVAARRATRTGPTSTVTATWGRMQTSRASSGCWAGGLAEADWRRLAPNRENGGNGGRAGGYLTLGWLEGVCYAGAALRVAGRLAHEHSHNRPLPGV